MGSHVTNPFNKLDLERLTLEEAIVAADLLLFSDQSASGKKERKITVGKLLEVFFPEYLRLNSLVDGGIELTDKLPFIDDSSPNPKDRKVSLADIAAAITPTIRASVTPTGMIVPFVGDTAPTGWILASGRTIGSAGSGATGLANASAEALFTILWTDYINTDYPIEDQDGNPTARGASAAADFAAAKRIPLPDYRGRVLIGRDNMGGTSANRITAGGCGINGDQVGAFGGAQSTILTIDQIPSHTHNVDVPSDGGGTGTDHVLMEHLQVGTTAVVSDPAGGGGPMSLVQPSIVATYIIKL